MACEGFNGASVARDGHKSGKVLVNCGNKRAVALWRANRVKIAVYSIHVASIQAGVKINTFPHPWPLALREWVAHSAG